TPGQLLGPGGPGGPGGPIGPIAPFAPVGPAGPIAPFAPVGPAGPVAPAGPAGPGVLLPTDPPPEMLLIVTCACASCSSRKFVPATNAGTTYTIADRLTAAINAATIDRFITLNHEIALYISDASWPLGNFVCIDTLEFNTQHR